MPRKNKPESKKTTITIEREIRDKLDSLKLVPGEYLDSVISRLIESYEDVKE